MLLKDCRSILYNSSLSELPKAKILINTINAHSFNVAKTNMPFREALINSHILLPDGVSIVWANRLLFGCKIRKTAGADLFKWEMERLNRTGGRVFFLGSSLSVLDKIKKRASVEYPNVIVSYFSPPFKKQFSLDESCKMVEAVNEFEPDVLFIGMTAPKQETWAADHFHKLKAGHICCVGAVFDFYAGSITRSPDWMVKIGMEWFYRFLKEPKRMWKRYLIGNSKFVFHILSEKMAA